MFPQSIVVAICTFLVCAAASQQLNSTPQPEAVNVAHVPTLPTTSDDSCVTPDCISTGTPQPEAVNIAHVPTLPTTSDDLCVTLDCISTAQRFLKSMNSRVKPCDDFYEFVCGNYATSSAPIPDSEKLNDINVESQFEVDSRLQKIITSINEYDAPMAFAELKISYTNCMKGGWNGESDRTSTEYVETANKWRTISMFEQDVEKFDKNSVFEFITTIKSVADPTNPQSKILRLSIEIPCIPWIDFKEGMTHKSVRDYLEYMNDIMEYLGVDLLKMEPILEKIISLEIELSRITLKENENYDINGKYFRITVGELAKQFPYWKLLNIFDGSDNSVVEMDEYINVGLMKKLEKIILRKSRKRLYNWLEWRKIMASFSTFDKYAKYRKEALLRSLVGYSQGHWRECVHEVMEKSPFLLDVLYYGKYLTDSVVKDSTKIFNNLQKKYVELIENASWLEAETKQHALKKIGQTTIDIDRYQHFMLHNESQTCYSIFGFLDPPLADIPINISDVLKHYKIHQNVHDQDNRLGYFVQNHASYSAALMLIVIGARYYTDVFYNIDRPKALNYGSFGSVIGHELGHALDDKNRHFNFDGIRKSWWDSQSNEIYINRTRCLVKQYRKYSFHQLNYVLTDYELSPLQWENANRRRDLYLTDLEFSSLRWKNADRRRDLYSASFRTRYDDAADNIGIKLAYYAYDEWTKKNKTEKRLPGLDYSPRQMFWISYANSLCTNHRPEAIPSSIKNDVHSLPKMRVNVPLSNMPEFANDFKCTPNTKMNPKKRCSIW